jgi:hypothetical protein
MRYPIRIALAASLPVLCQDAAFAAIRDVREASSSARTARRPISCTMAGP